MDLIAKRACVTGVIGVTVSIILRQDARGAIPREGMEALSQERDRAHGPSYSSISMETPVSPRGAGNIRDGEAESKCEQSLAATVDAGDLCLASQDEIVGYGRNGQHRVSQLASAPQPDSGTTWDSEGLHISLKSEIPLW